MNFITNNSTYGNAYGALDDVIRENGSIMSNPGMIGRLRAQQDYKKYIDNLCEWFENFQTLMNPTYNCK